MRRACVALTVFTLACGDATAPEVNLTQAQVSDMLDAMSSVSSFGSGPGAGLYRSGSAPGTANATATISQTVACPNGGSATVNGTATDNPTAGTVTVQITQSFSACAATSSEGRLWTFNGDPNIVTNISASSNVTTGAFSMTATQVGGIKFASELGSGSCQINLTLTMSGNESSFSGTLSGTACGQTVQRSISFTT